MRKRDRLARDRGADARRRRVGAGLRGLGLVAWLVFTGAAIAGDEMQRADAPPGGIHFVGRNRIATANGTFHAWRVVEQSIDPDRLASSRIVVEVDLASVDTGSHRRDEHLRTGDFFEVESWPTARVVVDGFEPPTWRARFTVDLHGVTRVLEGRVLRTGDTPVVFEGELVLDRTEFGIGAEPSRWNPMSIEAGIPVRFRYVMEEAS